ncbi:MAG: metal-dependent hydrolase [Candidatus Hodarchaeota archaeon]
MNGITHFLTGYLLVGRGLKYKNTRVESFLAGIFALVPDVDSIINQFVPFEHGVFTHTLIGGLLFALIAAFITAGVIRLVSPGLFQKDHERHISVSRILLLSILGMFSHLALDMWTYHYGEADNTHHMYFWPLWNFAFHIDDIFPGPRDLMWDIRVLVEVVYTIVIVAFILFYQWAKKKENPFYMFSPWHWVESDRSRQTWVKALVMILGALVIGLSQLVLGMVLLSLIATTVLGIIYRIDTKQEKEKIKD